MFVNNIDNRVYGGVGVRCNVGLWIGQLEWCKFNEVACGSA